MGTCLLVSQECPIHENYKQAILKAKDSGTIVTGRIAGTPVRILKNQMARTYVSKERAGATMMELEQYTLGSLRRAVFDGDTKTGSLMAGQVAGMLHEIKPLRQIFEELDVYKRQVYTKEAETADAYIEKTTYEIAREHRVRVVTSDGAEQLIILGHGALRLPAASFRREVEEAEGEISAILARHNRGERSRPVKEALERAAAKERSGPRSCLLYTSSRPESRTEGQRRSCPCPSSSKRCRAARAGSRRGDAAQRS